MRLINVIKPFNLLLPAAGSEQMGIQRFDIGVHEVGTYRKPVWDRAKDAAVDGEFTEQEIGEHPWVKLHCGPMPTAEELRKRAAKLTAEAAAMRRQAEESAAVSEKQRKADALGDAYDSLSSDEPPPRAA